MPVLRTRIKTSLMPILGSAISSSHRPGSRRLFTKAFIYVYDSLWSRRSHFVVCLAARTRQTTKCDRLPHNGDSGQTPPSLCGDYGIPDPRVRGGGAARGGGSDAGHRPLPHHG